MGSIAVLIPCYNEAVTIANVVRDFHEALPTAVIYVYDNNSTDGTAAVARAAGALVKQECHQGKGNVVRAMFRQIDADCYLMVDGDDTYPAENARQMVEMILDGKADMVNGDRLSATYFSQNKRCFHNLGNRVVRGLVNHLFRTNVRDILTGYRAFSRDFAKTFPALSKGFDVEAEITIHAVDKNFSIEEIPVAYRDRPAGSESKLHTFTDGAKVLGMIFRLYRNYKPLAFFSALSLIFLAVVIACFVPVWADYLQTGMVPKFPTLIISATAAICALLSFLVGVILDVFVRKHRQLFEILLNISTEVNRNGERQPHNGGKFT